MAACPCPRCLIPKVRAHLTGTKRDGKQRVSLARVDDLRYRAKISSARKIIYQNKHPVSSVLVQRLLKSESLVPTEVALSFIPSVLATHYWLFRMPFRVNFLALALICFPYFWWTLCMKSSLGFGRKSLSIYSES